MISYQIESFSSIRDEVFELSKDHYAEVDSERNTFKLDPNFEVYEELEKMGGLTILVVRDDNKIIGYAFFITNFSLHCKTVILAINDLFYVKPEYRGKEIGKILLEKSEEALKQRGVHQIIMMTKKYANFSPLLERNGYEEIEAVYKKNIK